MKSTSEFSFLKFILLLTLSCNYLKNNDCVLLKYNDTVYFSMYIIET